MKDNLKCPQCDQGSIVQRDYTWYSFVSVTSFSEVILGQCQPAVEYYCKDCDPTEVQGWAVCGNCNAILPAQLWIGWKNGGL